MSNTRAKTMTKWDMMHVFKIMPLCKVALNRITDIYKCICTWHFMYMYKYDEMKWFHEKLQID